MARRKKNEFHDVKPKTGATIGDEFQIRKNSSKTYKRALMTTAICALNSPRFKSSINFVGSIPSPSKTANPQPLKLCVCISKEPSSSKMDCRSKNLRVESTPSLLLISTL